MKKVIEPEFLCHQINSILNKVINNCDAVVTQDIEKKLLNLKVDIISLRFWGKHYREKYTEVKSHVVDSRSEYVVTKDTDE